MKLSSLFVIVTLTAAAVAAPADDSPTTVVVQPTTVVVQPTTVVVQPTTVVVQPTTDAEQPTTEADQPTTVADYFTTVVYTTDDDVSTEAACAEEEDEDPDYNIGVYDFQVQGNKTMDWTWTGAADETLSGVLLTRRNGTANVTTVAGGIGESFITLNFALSNTCTFGYDVEISVISEE